MRGVNWKTTFAVALLTGSASAIDLNVNNETSVKNAASLVAKNTISDYNDRDAKNIPGKLDRAWFEGGVLFDALIRYWYYTGDAANNDAVSDGMYWQMGDDNFFPSNYSQVLGNDDQMMWALAAMTAAELDYPQRPSKPSWITLATNVFNAQIRRWDEDSCNGGLRWQIWPYQAGYTTKNAITNGGLFELAARLALFTNNQTYSDWAEKIWDWSATTPLLKNATWTVSDSTTCESDCTDHSNFQWSYNYGVYMAGAAYMYNLTDGNAKWKSGLDGLLNSTSIFFPSHGYNSANGKVMVEVTCESVETCNVSMDILKGTFVQDLAQITVVAPYTSSKILPLLQGSATAAAMTCTGGTSGSFCSARWYMKKFEENDGFAVQVAALSLFTSNLVAFNSHAPATQATASNSTATTSGNGTTTTTSSSAAGATTTGSNAANMLASSSVGVVAAAAFAALLALF